MTATVQVLKPHVSINVRNLDNSLDFYRKMLGIEPSTRRRNRANGRITRISADGFVLVSAEQEGFPAGSTVPVHLFALAWKD